MEVKQIPDYPNYVVSPDGCIVNKKGKPMKPQQNKVTGYYTVMLCHEGKAKSYYVHRLVALAFIPNPNDYSDIDHINHDKSDNRIENLRWCTRSMNMRNMPAYKNGTSKFRGVSRSTNSLLWYAQISLNGKPTSLGRHVSEIEAAKAYDAVARENGFFHFNFPDTLN